MRAGIYTFQARFVETAQLPPYKGSTFRGAFGHALKRVLCSNRQGVCEQCLLAERCLYTQAFEAPLQNEPNTPTPPQPYVIEPPLDTRSIYAPEDPFEFQLLLFGSITDYLPYFIYAFERLGQLGLGSRRDGAKGTFRLERVTCFGKELYSSEAQHLENTQHCLIDLEIPNEMQAASGELHVRLITPLRFKYNSSLVTELPFQMLVRALIRRISTMFHHFNGGEPSLDYRGLMHRAMDVEQISSTLRWHDWSRYSNRQERSMQMGGLIGESVYRGCLSEFLPLLEAGKLLHIGKQSTFGLGKIEYDFHEAKG